MTTALAEAPSGASLPVDWIDIGILDDIPKRGARVVKTARGDIAIFRTMDDKLFALDDKCPHRGGPLSQGIVQGSSVTCPLHNWVIDLATGEAQGADQGCTRTIAVRIDQGRVQLAWPGRTERAA